MFRFDDLPPRRLLISLARSLTQQRSVWKDPQPTAIGSPDSVSDVCKLREIFSLLPSMEEEEEKLSCHADDEEEDEELHVNRTGLILISFVEQML